MLNELKLTLDGLHKCETFLYLFKDSLILNELKVIPLKLFYHQTFFETWRD